MVGAKGVLFNVSGGANIGIHEIQEAAQIINNASDEDAFVIWGHVFDPDMDDAVKITVIATGFDESAGTVKTDPFGTPKVVMKPTSVSMTEATVSTASPSLQNSAQAPARPRVEIGETDVKLAGLGEQENLFSEVPANQLDVPSYLRKKRP